MLCTWLNKKKGCKNHIFPTKKLYTFVKYKQIIKNRLLVWPIQYNDKYIAYA